MRKHTDEIAELVKLGRVRNRLLTAKAVQVELRAAAQRVVRLSQPGTPERFFTLMTVADETGLSSGAIVDAILQADDDDQARSDTRDSPASSSPPHRNEG